MGVQLGQGGPPTQVAISRSEAEMLVRITSAIADFAEDFALEFNAYCNPSRWTPVLERVVKGIGQIETQLRDKSKTFVTAPSDLVFALMDLEECVSGARDARLSSSKIALIISAAGAFGEIILGIPWLGLPSYIASLAIILGRPAVAFFEKEPTAPFQVDVPPPIGGGIVSLGETRGRVKFLEYSVVGPGERHWWGAVLPGGAAVGRVCLAKGLFRVVVEGAGRGRITPATGWRFVGPEECANAEHVIISWSPCGSSMLEWARAIFSERDGIWAEYIGPNTGGVCRKAGPFCCPFDAGDHAVEDGGIEHPGLDGGYVLFGPDGSVLKEAM